MATTGRDGIEGFTLIELMVVVAIVAILATVAYPSYRQYTIRSNRAAAQSFMLDVANKEEQLFIDNRGYVAVTGNAQFPNAPTAGGLNLTVPDKVNSFYTVTVALPTASGAPPGYTITATPAIGTIQTADPTLTLTNQGVKTPSAKW